MDLCKKSSASPGLAIKALIDNSQHHVKEIDRRKVTNLQEGSKTNTIAMVCSVTITVSPDVAKVLLNKYI